MSIPIYKTGVYMPAEDLRKLIADAYQRGMENFYRENGQINAFYSYNALKKKYTRSVVDNWIECKKIIPLRVGKSLRFDRREVEKIANSDLYGAGLCRLEY